MLILKVEGAIKSEPDRVANKMAPEENEIGSSLVAINWGEKGGPFNIAKQ